MNKRPSTLQSLNGALHPFDLVVIAASFGGVKALSCILSGLPAAFPVPIIVAQHLSPRFPSMLAEVLDRRTKLQVSWGRHGTRVSSGNVYLAPPDHHALLTSAYTLSLSQGPKVSFARPAADVLFTSVAAVSQHRTLGIVLTGYGQDGAMGAEAIKQARGTIIAQDPSTCEGSPMPSATIDRGVVDFVLPIEQIASALVSLVMASGSAHTQVNEAVNARPILADPSISVDGPPA